MIFGFLALLIYLPIFLFMVKKDFRKRFSRIDSQGFDVLIEILVGIFYFLIILFSFFEPVKNGLATILGIFIYFPFLYLTYRGYFFFYANSGLITKDVFKISRNPTYFFAFLAIFGISIMTLSLRIFLLLAATMILTHKIILNEEKYLEKKFGRKYFEYKKKVKRYLIV